LRAWLAVAPLSVFAGFHAWVVYPAVHSQQAWLDRALPLRLAPWAWALVLALLGMHFTSACAELVARRRACRQDPALRDTSIGFEGAMLALLAGFVVFHVVSLGVRTDDAQVAARAAYGYLWASLGLPLQLGVYAVGITALAFHLALGAAHALTRHFGRPRLWRTVAGVAAFLLWFSFAQALGRFATGEALMPWLVVGAPER
jgi:hypothetical protein